MFALFLQILLLLLSTLFSLFVWVFVLPKVIYRRSLPGPRPSLIWGNTLEFARNVGRAPRVFQRFRDIYGRCYQVWFFYHRIAVLSDVEDVKFIAQTVNAPKSTAFKRTLMVFGGKGLLIVDEKLHPARRRVIAKHMHGDFMRHLHEHIRAQAAIWAKKLREAATRDEPLDLDKTATALTLDVICSTGFGRSANAQADLNEELPQAIARTMFELGRNVALYPFRNVFGWYLNPPLRAACDVIQRFALDAWHTRLTEPPEARQARPMDLLDVFLDAMGEGVKFDVLSEVVTFMLAGHETTAHSIAWTVFEVAQRPEVQQQIQAEVDALYGERTEFLLPFEDVARLEYLGRVWKEALRLHPVAATGTYREMPYDVQLPGTGYVLERGTKVLMPPYVLHRDPEYWPEPEAFRPERFIREAIAQRHPFAYQAFSSGPRNCIGQAVATHEAMALLGALYRHYRVQLACAPSDVAEFHDLTLKPQLVIGPRRQPHPGAGLPLRLSARSEAGRA